MPTRFRYTPVKPEAFALTPVEILLATDQELNEYVSIKKYAPYRRDFSWDKDRNAKLRDLKMRIAERTGIDASGDRGGGVDGQTRGAKPAKKRKGRKERMKAKAAAEAAANDTTEDEAQQLGKRKLDDQAEDAHDAGNGDAGTKKRKRRHKKKPAIE